MDPQDNAPNPAAEPSNGRKPWTAPRFEAINIIEDTRAGENFDVEGVGSDDFT